MAKEAVRGGAPPHKNNLIGKAAGGVSKLVPFKSGHHALARALFHPRSSTCSFADALEASLDTRL